jgi:hypothetical protein
MANCLTERAMRSVTTAASSPISTQWSGKKPIPEALISLE